MKRRHPLLVAALAMPAACLFACQTLDPNDPLQSPGFKAAVEANRRAPYVYDRQPTRAERDQVRAACQEYVRQQSAALMADVIANPNVHSVMNPSVERCETQHFNRQAHDAAVELYRQRPSNALPAY